LADEVLSEAVVRLFVDEFESRLLIDAVGSGENALRPERDFGVSGGARKADTFVNKNLAEAEATGGGIDIEQAQFGGFGLVGMADKEDVADVATVDLGDPATLAGGIKVGDEVGGDAGDESFEGVVPAILLDIASAFEGSDYAHVAGAVGAQGVWGFHRFLYETSLLREHARQKTDKKKKDADPEKCVSHLMGVERDSWRGGRAKYQ
jgi:hypothetical protein